MYWQVEMGWTLFRSPVRIIENEAIPLQLGLPKLFQIWQACFFYYLHRNVSNIIMKAFKSFLHDISPARKTFSLYKLNSESFLSFRLQPCSFVLFFQSVPSLATYKPDWKVCAWACVINLRESCLCIKRKCNIHGKGGGEVFVKLRTGLNIFLIRFWFTRCGRCGFWSSSMPSNSFNF